MPIKLKSLHGLATVVNNAITAFNTNIREWITANFSPKSHTHTKSQITDFKHTHAISEVITLKTTLDDKAAKDHTHTAYAAKNHTHSSYLTRFPAPKFSSPIGSVISRDTLSDGYTVKQDCYVQIVMSGVSGYEAVANFTVSGHSVARACFSINLWRSDCNAIIPVCNGSLIKVTGDVENFTIYARLFEYWK